MPRWAEAYVQNLLWKGRIFCVCLFNFANTFESANSPLSLVVNKTTCLISLPISQQDDWFTYLTASYAASGGIVAGHDPQTAVSAEYKPEYGVWAQLFLCISGWSPAWLELDKSTHSPMPHIQNHSVGRWEVILSSFPPVVGFLLQHSYLICMLMPSIFKIKIKMTIFLLIYSFSRAIREKISTKPTNTWTKHNTVCDDSPGPNTVPEHRECANKCLLIDQKCI